MIWGVLAQWLVRVVGVVLVGVLTLAFWHLLDLAINRRRNLMHVAGPRPLPILGRHRAEPGQAALFPIGCKTKPNYVLSRSHNGRRGSH